MTLEQVRDVFMWCSVINVGMLTLWCVMILLARDWIYRLHSRWFPMSKESFAIIHYCGIGLYKMAVFFLCVIPYVALLIVG
jgi:hypothetical protein